MLCNQAWLVAALPYARISGIVEGASVNINVSIDTRTLRSGELFIAMVGAQVDGHNFVQKALELGACGVMIRDAACLDALPAHLVANKIIIQVPDTWQALKDLAIAHRQRLNIPIVGITGSVGKTSTKGMLGSILEQAHMNAYISYKNQNTNIGVCINVLNVTQDHVCAVFELGINAVGEMAELVDIVKPTHAIITTLTYAHAKHLGDLQNIAREKRMIFKNFSMTNIGVVCGDTPLLVNPGYHHPVARFGLKTSNHVQARKITLTENEQGDVVITFMLKWYDKKVAVRMPVAHRGMVNNALAAATMAYQLGISCEAVVAGLEHYQGTEQRFELKPIVQDKGLIISDCYNANPESMKAALECFNVMKSVNAKIAILGDMLELGDREIYWHRRIGRFIRDLESINTVILVGNLAQHMAYAIPSNIAIHYALDWQEASQKLQELLQAQKALVLVKGSRSVKLDKLVAQFQAP